MNGGHPPSDSKAFATPATWRSSRARASGPKGAGPAAAPNLGPFWRPSDLAGDPNSMATSSADPLSQIALTLWPMGGAGPAGIIRLDGEFPAGPVDQHGQPDRLGRPRSIRASRAARVERPVNRTSSTSTIILSSTSRYVRRPDVGLGVSWVEVVPVEGDVQHPHPHRPGGPAG